MRKLTKEEFINRSNKIHNNKYDYSLVEYINNRIHVKIVCKEHGIFEQSPDHHGMGIGCPKCGGTKNLDKYEFIEKSNKIHNNKYDYSLVNYKNNKTKVKIICKIHGEFEQRPDVHLQGQGCSECKKELLSKLRKFTTTDFKRMSKKIHGDKYDYSLSIYNGTEIKVKIICSVHGVFNQTPHNHINQKQGCPKCGTEKASNKSKTSLKKFIYDSSKIHNNKYDYSLVNYINGKTKVKIICPIHKEFIQNPNSHLNGNGCPSCKESSGEKKIYEYLSVNNINFERQKSFNGCKYIKPLKFDFFLPDYNICIEFDGEQHYVINEYFGGIKSFENQQKRDKIKTDFCINNNIKLLRIKYNEIENIENILNIFLKIYFNTNEEIN